MRPSETTFCFLTRENSDALSFVSTPKLGYKSNVNANANVSTNTISYPHTNTKQLLFWALVKYQALS